MEKRTILTTSSRGLLEDSFPYRLYQKAKKVGVWNRFEPGHKRLANII
jgi:ribonucleoside-diphosphate reductase beta chain